MCGLAGFLRTGDTPNRDSHQNFLTEMGNAVYHRGPDAGSTYINDDIALVHRRLSILDLSEAGTQPMVSSNNRYVIVFNGEIYNFIELRKDLEKEGISFKTHTDTEVLLVLYEKYGADCLKFLNGMFAFAIWDSLSKDLFLARDRLGKKPLYFYRQGNRFAFASEIKSLLKLPFVEREIRNDAAKDFFAYQYIPDPKTIYKNIHKLKPGYCLRLSGDTLTEAQYWDVTFSDENTNKLSLNEAEEGLYERINEATRLRMISDVPLGAFLSGGVDSSAIVGLMANQSETPITTCSIGFDSKKFDEVKFAKKVADQFGTDHHEFTVKENVAGNLEQITRYFDEPFADPSYVPTYFVSQLARKKVTVALAGDGGDENFAGYSKYYTDSVENRLRSMVPSFIRTALFPSLARMASLSNQTYFRKARSLLSTLALSPGEAFYVTNCFFKESTWNDLVTGSFKNETKDYSPAKITTDYYNNAKASDHLSKILYTDIKTYLPGDILVKVDRMSMANSLETRAPLLDYNVVEYAANIPASLKLNGAEKKYILKTTFSKLLDDEILYRKKMGFSVPLAEWLRNEIRPLGEKYLLASDNGISNLFDMTKVKSMWTDHQSGSDVNTQELWSMLAFEMWWQQYNV